MQKGRRLRRGGRRKDGQGNCSAHGSCGVQHSRREAGFAALYVRRGGRCQGRKEKSNGECGDDCRYEEISPVGAGRLDQGDPEETQRRERRAHEQQWLDASLGEYSRTELGARDDAERHGQEGESGADRVITQDVLEVEGEEIPHREKRPAD